MTRPVRPENTVAGSEGRRAYGRRPRGPDGVFGKDTVNGVAVKNLRHLVEMLRDCRQQMVVLEFADHGLETMVFPHQEMLAATAEVLTHNGIRSRGSPDLLAVWGAKAERRADAEMRSLSNWSVL